MGRRRKKAEYTIPPGRLWPNTPSGAELAIEVFGATGEYKSGKTLLGLSIAPGAHPDKLPDGSDHPFAGKPRTLYLDFEKSGGTYGGTGCKRIDVPLEMQGIFTDEKTGMVRPYKPIDVFEWFDRLIGHLQPGQFDLIMADPITDIESGEVAYVRKHHREFGLTDNQIAKGGFLWGAVKDFWKQTLLKLSTRCQTFYFTSHLRSVWDGNQPVRGKKEPKGKETLMELASLYLWLERKADDDGNVPAVPSGIVLKERLADTVMTEDGHLEITQLMPPRLPEATVDAIREYIARPPGDKLRDDEKVIEEEMGEEDKLRLQDSIAHAQADAEGSRLASLTRQAELRAMDAKARRDAPQPNDQTARIQAEKAAAEKKRPIEQEAVDAEQAEIDAEIAKSEAGIAESDAEGKRLVDSQPEEHRPAGQSGQSGKPSEEKASVEQVAEIKRLVVALKMTPEQLTKVLVKVGCTSVSALPAEQATRFADVLKEAWVARGQPTEKAPAGN